MIKKTFILTQFGEPHEWTQQFIDHVQHLEKYGWYWKIFTPNKFESKGNVEIVPMSVEDFNYLVDVKLGVRPNLFVTKKGVPSVHVTDFYIFTGLIFEHWLKDSDFWGITNIDVVYGRLDHYLPDEYLEDCDVFTDDVNVVNGVFSLWRNIPKVNELCKLVSDWRDVIAQPPCPRCQTGEGSHTLFGSDEYGMTEVLRWQHVLSEIRYKYPKYYPIHSYDRLEQHIPEVKLEMHEDGSLFEQFKDMAPPATYIHFPKKMFGREIAYFHFIKTKKWPPIKQY